TGLPNRAAFQQAMDQRSGAYAVLLVDLDAFKEINDTLGHHTGDRLLVDVGRRLAGALPDAVVARLGGDEFALLLPDGDALAALRAAAHLRDVVSGTFSLRGLPVRVDASVGIAVAPRDGHDSTSLLQRADVAMYAAKAARSGVE